MRQLFDPSQGPSSSFNPLNAWVCCTVLTLASCPTIINSTPFHFLKHPSLDDKLYITNYLSD
jgi:hypothetical protein